LGKIRVSDFADVTERSQDLSVHNSFFVRREPQLRRPGQKLLSFWVWLVVRSRDRATPPTWAGRGAEGAAAPGAQSCLRVQRGVRRQGQVEAADRGAGGDAHRRGRRRARAHGRQRRDPSAGAAGQPQRRRQARSTQCPARCCLATSPQLRFAGAVRVIANRRVEVARHRAAGFRRPGRVGGGCQAPRAAQPCLPPPTRRCRISPGRQP
jgi:hypothetical protein